jgi:hypothetical protein
MSTWLADAVAAYVERLTERDFDVPFIAMLHHMGFKQVHLTHGAYEFGKDFIARRTEDGVTTQWCFQSKAGNIAKKAWREEVSPQVQLMRTGTIVHPSFDPDLPRRIVVVTTGRLNGSAGIEMQQNNAYAKSRGELICDLWDIDYLVPTLVECLIVRRSPLEQARLLEMVGRIRSGLGNRTDIASLASRWLLAPEQRSQSGKTKKALTKSDSDKHRWGDVLISCLLANEAAAAGREDLAVQATYLLIRSYHRELPDSATNQKKGAAPDKTILDLAHRAFAAVAEPFWEQVRVAPQPIELTTSGVTALSVFLTHPIKVARLCETLGMLALWHHEHGDVDTATEISTCLASLTADAVGVWHPIGDEWSFSVLVAVVAMAVCGESRSAVAGVRTTAVWLLDLVEQRRGFPGVGADPREVVETVLARRVIGQPAPPDSALVGLAIVTDLALLLGENELASDIVQSTWAVGALATLVVPKNVESGTRVARIDYSVLPAVPTHHKDEVTASWPVGSVFDSVAIWATQRDRYLPGVLSPMLEP